MSTPQNMISSNRREEKDLCFRAFSSAPQTLTHKQIQRQRPTLGQDIIDNFEEIGRTDSESANVVQCLTCRTILIRPRSHYNNLRRHLTSHYHKRLERMVSRCMNDTEAESEGKTDKEPSVKEKKNDIFQFDKKDLLALRQSNSNYLDDEVSKSTGMIFALSILS